MEPGCELGGNARTLYHGSGAAVCGQRSGGRARRAVHDPGSGRSVSAFSPQIALMIADKAKVSRELTRKGRIIVRRGVRKAISK
jgi:hypothetical protein